MYVQTFCNSADLSRLRGQWDALAGGIPFRMHLWLHSWWRHYAGRQRLMVLAVSDTEGRLAGLAPWSIQRTASGARAIQPLGSGEVCSDYLSILTRDADQDTVATALADYLIASDCSPWDRLELPGIDADDGAVARLADALEARGQEVHRRPSHRCWRIALPKTWDDYLALQSKSHRKQLRRLHAQMFETGRAVLHQARDAESLEQAWQILVELHQRRRTGLGERGCFASPRFSAFHRDVVRGMLEAGRLRLYWLELDGRPVAAEYQLAGDGVTYAYQSGVDPRRLSDEPGRLITMATIQEAIRQGQHGFDFLRGDEPYKAHWRAQPRQMYDHCIVSSRAGARLRHRVRSAADGIEGWLKQGLGLLSGKGA